MECIQHLPHVLLVLFERLREDEDVVEITHCEPVQEWMDCVVHDGLECRRRIRQAERHHEVLEMPMTSAKCRLPFVPFLDADVGVCGRKVEACEVSCACQLVPQLRDQGQGVPVLHRLAVQLSVVHTHPELAILLWHEKDWVAGRRCRRPDVSDLEVLREIVPQLLVLEFVGVIHLEEF